MAFKVQPLGYSDQVIHMEVQPCSGAPSFYCSFVYAHNTANERKDLWEDLRGFKRKFDGPWLLMGDINCVLDYGERLGSMVRQHEIDPGKTCFKECGLSDIAYTGCFYTWSNKQEAEERQKLKAIKQELKELNKMHFSNIHLETEDAHKALLQIQKELQENPASKDLCSKERRVTEHYKKKLHCYVQFLQQKARIKWLQEGDDNTALFHRSLKAQRLRSNLYTIYNMQGQLQSDPDSVSKAFLDYYEKLIGKADEGGRQQVMME
ncbi:Tryptophan synthase alpha chain, partial [Bienertia sinuspersici]